MHSAMRRQDTGDIFDQHRTIARTEIAEEVVVVRGRRKVASSETGVC